MYFSDCPPIAVGEKRCNPLTKADFCEEHEIDGRLTEFTVYGTLSLSADIVFKSDNGTSYLFKGSDIFTPMYKWTFELNGGMGGM